MVSNKPRFGGGIRMEVYNKQRTEAPPCGEQNIIKMEVTGQLLPGSTSRQLPAEAEASCGEKNIIKMAATSQILPGSTSRQLPAEAEAPCGEKNIIKMAATSQILPGSTSWQLPEEGGEKKSQTSESRYAEFAVYENEATTSLHEENLWPKCDDPVLSSVDENYHGIIPNSFHVTSSVDHVGGDVQRECSPTASEPIRGTDDGLDAEPLAHQEGKKTRKVAGDTISDQAFPEDINSRDNESQGFFEANQPQNEQNLTKLRLLLEAFKTLGIQRKVTIYTKLSEDEKGYWSSVFLENLGNAIYQTSELVLEETVDVDIIYCKNLFLKDRKGQFYIVIAKDACPVDLKQLKQQLNAARNLSFATVDDLMNVLQVKPGGVTPFTIMQESAKNVRVALHESLYDVRESGHTKLAFHPFSPLLQVNILFSELNSFIRHYKKELEILGEDRTKACTNATSDEFKKEDTKTLSSNIIKNGSREESKTNVKRVHRAKLDHTERKGKLKSYIKKNDSRNGKHLKNEQCATFGTGTSDEDEKDKHKSQEKSPLSNVDKIASTENQDVLDLDSMRNVNLRKATDLDLDKISPTKRLPEIDEFYNRLKMQGILYREIDVSSVTSNDIGPALGARCFLLKDKRQNYFVIVSHEFYELDYGRLKKSLHPKKKLDDCDFTDFPFILGVDLEHFTPFAVMNARARLNNVQIFFTEKITPDNVVLCVQHPFASSGHRLLMKSSELQRLLQPYSSNNCIGVVEEKAWLKKYNSAFSQFDDHSSKQTFHKTDAYGIIRRHPKSIPGQIRTESSDPCDTLDEIVAPEVTTRLDNRSHIYAPSDTNSNNTDTSTSIFNFSVRSHLRRENLFSNFLNKTRQIMSYLSLHNPDTVQQNITESSVDATEVHVRENCKTSTPHQEMEKIQGNESSLRDDKYHRAAASKMQSFPIQESFLSDSYNSNTANDAASVDELKQHLDMYNIEYVIKDTVNESGNKINCDDINDKNNDDNDDDSDDDDGDDQDSDSTSQICHTLHLTNESGLQNYLVVGRYSEHISVKRFRRRFQIENRLFLVNENEEETPFGDTAKTLTMTNPFSTLISAMKSCENKSHNNIPRVKFEMVLFSSIYMEPEMTCLFPLDANGTRHLCMTSQEVEKYAKSVGMDVWYMP